MIKKFSFILMMISFLQLSIAAKEIIIEAETGILSGTSVATETAGFSGTGYVTSFDAAGDSVTVNVDISTAGTYMLSFGYATPYGGKTNDIAVNGIAVGSVTFSAINTFTELTWETSITLKQGLNTISFINNWGWMLLDYFKIGGIGPKGDYTVTPKVPAISDSVIFDASAILDPNGTVVSYNWDFGDGTKATGSLVKHKFTNTQFYTVMLTATDNDTNVFKKSVVIKVVDGQPIPSVTYLPEMPAGGEEISFNADSTVDLNGSIINYEWDFGDGSTGSGKTIKHTYASDGNYLVSFTATDNEGNKKSALVTLRAYNTSYKIRGVSLDNSTVVTYNKAEASFQINGKYTNVYNPDEIAVDAIVKFGADSLVIPCFYFEQAIYNKETWVTTGSEKLWKVRFAPISTGMHSLYVKMKDSIGVYYSSPISFNVTEGANKGFIYVDKTDKQQFRHSTGEMYNPIGNNYAWTFSSSGIDRMKGMDEYFQSLNDNGSNFIRYWFAGFAAQSPEWTGDGYAGVGKYNQLVCALTDSIINNCGDKGINMQLVLYQHGMFSENVDPAWSSNPYNVANGGFLNKPAQFFTDTIAHKYAKQLMRYVVARWGYSQNIFTWELFNEVNFTGNTTSNPSTMKADIAVWHDIMSQYIKSVDPYKHLITTSSSGDNDQLVLMKDFKDMDLFEFHVYDNNPISYMNNQLTNLQSKISKPLLCGEFGIGNTSTKSDYTLRNILWYSYMRKVPAFYWYWNEMKENGQHQIYKPISALFSVEDPLVDLTTTTVTPGTFNASSKWFTTGKHGKKSWYGFASTESTGLQTGGIVADGIDFGYYDMLVIDAIDGDTLQTKEVTIINTEVNINLPAFEGAVAVRLTYKSAYTLPIAIAGLNQTNYFENTFKVDGAGSVDPNGGNLTYSWSITSKPKSSNVTIEDASAVSFDVKPDIEGYYSFRLVVSNGTQTSVADTVDIIATCKPIAIAGVDIDTISKRSLKLDGTSSYSPFSLPLTYRWTVASAPATSKARLAFSLTSKPTITPDKPGEYLIVLVVSDSYVASLPDTIKITITSTGIETSPYSISMIGVFPNPAKDRIFLSVPADWNGNSNFIISDINGRIVFNQNYIVNEGALEINLPASLTNGVYILQGSCDNNKALAKIIICK